MERVKTFEGGKGWLVTESKSSELCVEEDGS